MGNGFTFESGRAQPIADVAWQSENAFDAIGSAVKSAGIASSAWPLYALSAESAYGTVTSTTSFACGDFAQLFDMAARTVSLVVETYNHGETANSGSDAPFVVPSKIGTPTSGMSGYDGAANAWALAAAYSPAVGVAIPALFSGVAAAISASKYLVAAADGVGASLIVVAVYDAWIEPNIRDPKVFSDAAETWQQIAKLASESGTAIARCFPLQGWTGDAADALTKFFTGDAKQAVSDFSGLATAIANVLGYIARVQSNFNHWLAILAAANAVTIGALAVASRFVPVVGYGMATVSIGAFISELMVGINAAHTNAGSIAAMLTGQVKPDIDKLQNDVSTVKGRLGGNRLGVEFQSAYTDLERMAAEGPRFPRVAVPPTTTAPPTDPTAPSIGTGAGG